MLHLLYVYLSMSMYYFGGTVWRHQWITLRKIPEPSHAALQ